MDNNLLPVAAFREEILAKVANSAVTIVTAETGAGKSTQVPQFLAGAGYRVICTQPRRIAARTLAQRVANEMKTRLGERVGFRTAEERCDSAATEVLFVTDGLQLVRELAGEGGTGRKTVLVLDEVHEWNLNMEVLVAWSRQRVEAGDDLRIVLMSATIAAQSLADFFGGAPVISVPGRLFPVEQSHAGEHDLIDRVCEFARERKNVLVFQPGKKEIAATVASLEGLLGERALVLPLHGGLEPAEQNRCFEPVQTGMVKVVVATNVAQTSVTIPDIDAVVDSGVERRIELVDGIEGLYLKPVARADCFQRAGRAGRTKEGKYVLCSETSLNERPDFPKAEVLRSRLDQMVLRLAVQGFDATALKFFHQPDQATLSEAKRALVALGAMTVDGSVTPTGRRMAKFPLSVQFSRMLIEAERLGVVEQVATIAACLECGDIRARNGLWKSLTQERRSDLLAVLDVYNAGLTMKGGAGKSKADALREAGIFVKDFFRAGEIRRKLLDAVGGSLRSSSATFQSQKEEREAILRACVAGMVDHLYRNTGYGYQNGGGGTRELAKESVVADHPAWLVGLPFDIHGKNRRGRDFVLNLVGMATAVDPTWLVEVAPHLATEKTGLSPAYDPAKDVVTSVTQKFFNGQRVGEERVADGEHPEAAAVFARWLASQSNSSTREDLDVVLHANTARQERARQFNIRSGEGAFQVFSTSELVERFVAALEGARRIVEVKRPEALALPALDEELVAMVLSEQPDAIEILGVELAVEYRPDDAYYRRPVSPRVKLSEELVTSNRWLELPDEGVRLPGGRLVEVSISFGWSANFASTDILQLKEKVREHLNRELWERWGAKPPIALPDSEAEEVSIPFVTACYGKCVVTGADLPAFGTVRPRSSRYYDSDPWFDVVWCRSESEARSAEAASLQTLEAARQAAVEQKEKVALVAVAEAAREELKALRSREGYGELEYELRSQVEGRTGYYASLPSSASGIRAWISEAKALVAKVEEILADRDAADARRAEVGEQIQELRRLHGWSQAVHIIVRENGEVAVNCGKSTKMGRFDVSSSIGQRQYGPESLDKEGRLVMWQPIPVSQKVTVSDYAGSGTLNSEVSFVVPAGQLGPGVWAVADDGKVLYPVIYFRSGCEVIPEKVTAVQAGQVPAPAAVSDKTEQPRRPVEATTSPKGAPVDLDEIDLSGLFGGSVSVSRRK